MKISALRLFNVKRFGGRGVAIEGIGDGVNVLCAANEFGKTTSFEALHALFFQPHSSTAGDVRAIRPYSGGNPLIEADVATDDGSYRITKQYYGGRSARVVELDSGRLIAQADEAENFIANLVRGGSGGPAGLLWVRQGTTGLEKRSSADEKSETQVRASLLESVQGEVEAVTGGRRMAEIMAAASEACAELITATGRPRAGGRYAAAIGERDRLASEEQRLSQEVVALRDALDRRTVAQRRLAELDMAEDRAARRHAIETAQAEFDTARAQNDRLKVAQAERNLAQERWDTADREKRRFQDGLKQATVLHEQVQAAARRQRDAKDLRRDAAEAIETARTQAETAEADEFSARELLARLEAAEKAREAADRLAELKDRLRRAEEVRQAIEESEAQLAQTTIPAGAIDELGDLDIEIARIRAVRDAARPTVSIRYDQGVTARVTMDDEPLGDDDELGYNGHARLVAPGLGTITLRSHRAETDDDRLEQTEAKRANLLAAMGVDDLSAARLQQERARQYEAQIREGRAQLALLAPDGLAKLREEITANIPADAEPVEFKADPVATRLSLDDAEARRKEAGRTLREMEPKRTSADDAFVRAETELAGIQAEMQQVTAILGPEDEREQRRRSLDDDARLLNAALAEAEAGVANIEAAAVDLESAAAVLKRVLSVDQAVDMEIRQLREALAGLTAQIQTRSDEAVEEKWLESREALSSASDRVAAFEKEVQTLQCLSGALESARSQARELYLRPVMTELKPLLGLLFDDVSITFDEKTLLPHTIQRAGLEEDVDRLSGGMREQLSILTRLAFARLLARDGRSAPVILDDALVYSDDDRIEKMFDALHRQSLGQQIIVFSCRQRAFQKLGGNVLQMADWQP
ncbi:MAG TPA: DNA-binding protein [Novosphingobium sp.]